MILTLGLVCLGLVMCLWLFTMYAMYKNQESEDLKPITKEKVVSVVDKAERLARRGVYATELYTKKGGSWLEEKLTSGFVKVVPSSAPAFVQKDELAGLKTGPMSYFLKSISEKRGKKRLVK
jgi:hypothetical protein